MKDKFDDAMPIFEFNMKCPKDGSIHRAFIRARQLPSGDWFPISTECHKSLGDYVCSTCCTVVKLAFFNDQVPDFFLQPLYPPDLPAWPTP